MKNPYSKTNKDGYFKWSEGEFHFTLLKSYQAPDKALANPHARVLVRCKSPMTMGEGDLGDSYLSSHRPLMSHFTKLVYEEETREHL